MNEFSKELMHMTDAEKRAYNREYYRKNREYWKNYAETGHGIGRQSSNGLGTPGASGRPKTYGGPTTGGYRRGEGLNASKSGLGTPGASGRPKTYGGPTTGGYRRGEGLNATRAAIQRSKEEAQTYNKKRYELMGKPQNFGGDNNSYQSERANQRLKSHAFAAKAEAEAARKKAYHLSPVSGAGQSGNKLDAQGRIKSKMKNVVDSMEAISANHRAKEQQKIVNAIQGDQARLAAERKANQKNQANKPLSARLSKTSASSVTSSPSHASGADFVKKKFQHGGGSSGPGFQARPNTPWSSSIGPNGIARPKRKHGGSW